MSISITSSAFAEGARIPQQYTGDGIDISPPLSWQGVPGRARELALICDDPDAPTSEPWVHWVLYKIPVALGELPEGVSTAEKPLAPAGSMQGTNSWKAIGYRGPAPPHGHGTHHYHFKLYALDGELNVKPGLDKKELLKALMKHVVGEGELVGTYERS